MEGHVARFTNEEKEQLKGNGEHGRKRTIEWKWRTRTKEGRK